MRTIYLISGPAGAGKSTISKALANELPSSACIEGDLIHHMIVGGYKAPWESEEQLELVWRNIEDIAINFVRADMDVVVDYVAFPHEMERFCKRVHHSLECEIKYVVLEVDTENLILRDALRPIEKQMGARSRELAEQFEDQAVDRKYVFNTTRFNEQQLKNMIDFILLGDRFRVEL